MVGAGEAGTGELLGEEDGEMITPSPTLTLRSDFCIGSSYKSWHAAVLDLQTAKIRDNQSGPALLHLVALPQAMQGAGGNLNAFKLGASRVATRQKKQRLLPVEKIVAVTRITGCLILITFPAHLLVWKARVG